MIYRVTLALDLDAASEAEASEAAERLRVLHGDETLSAEVVAVENEDWEEVQ